MITIAYGDYNMDLLGNIILADNIKKQIKMSYKRNQNSHKFGHQNTNEQYQHQPVYHSGLSA